MTRVLTELADGVATITLNDPKRRNALDLDFNEELFAAFDAIEADPQVGAVVITGAPPAFCAGADLSHLGEKGSKEGLLAIYEGFMRVGRCPLPTIAAVNGPAVGAGMNLALVCDLRLAGASARFDTRFLNLGIHPGGGHTWMFQRIAGPQTTFASVVFGEVLDGEAAEKVGLVWRCVPDDELLPAAREMAGRALNAPVELVKKITATIREIGSIDDHREAMLRELDPQAWSTEQPHFQATLAKLRERISSTSPLTPPDVVETPTARSSIRAFIHPSDVRHQPAARWNVPSFKLRRRTADSCSVSATSHIESIGSATTVTATAEHHAGPANNHAASHAIGGRVVIVDRHALVAQSLAMVLATASVTTFIATDPSFELVLRQVRSFDPDLVLVDAGAGDSIELIRAIARLGHRVVALSDGSDRMRVAACIEAGAHGAVSTLDPVPRLLATIRETVAGRRIMPSATERDLLCELHSHRRDRAAQLSRFHQLSVRESEVLEELMAGKCAADIATESYVSIATIRSQIKAILRKLEVSSQLAAVALAYRSGWSRMALRATSASARRLDRPTPRR